MKCRHALPLSHPFIVRRSHAHPLSDLHASPFPGPDASGLRKRHSLPPHPPHGLEWWPLSLGQAGAAGVWGGRQLRPWSQPVPSSPPPLPRTPSPGSPEPSQRGGIPLAVPPPTWRGRGRGSRPRQAWGEIPRPLPLGPTPPSPLISQQRPPAAPRAWGEASAGAWEGGGGDREGDGWWPGAQSGPPGPDILPPSLACPPLTSPPPGCPACKDLSPLCQYPPYSSPAPDRGRREDSRKATVLVVVTGPAKTSLRMSLCLIHRLGGGVCVWGGVIPTQLAG